MFLKGEQHTHTKDIEQSSYSEALNIWFTSHNKRPHYFVILPVNVFLTCRYKLDWKINDRLISCSLLYREKFGYHILWRNLLTTLESQTLNWIKYHCKQIDIEYYNYDSRRKKYLYARLQLFSRKYFIKSRNYSRWIDRWVNINN